MIPVLLYQTSVNRISLDQFDQVAFNYHKIGFTSLYLNVVGKSKMLIVTNTVIRSYIVKQ